MKISTLSTLIEARKHLLAASQLLESVPVQEVPLVEAIARIDAEADYLNRLPTMAVPQRVMTHA